VPKTFSEKDELVWTLVTHGKAEHAYATLRPDYFVDNVVEASELGAFAGAALTPDIHTNERPTVEIEGLKSRTIKVGQPLTLIARATDDGKPKVPPRMGAAGRSPLTTPPRQGILTDAVGLRLAWYVYRGAANVSFTPEQFKVWEDTRADANSPWSPYWVTPPITPDGKWVVEAVFSEPGTYALRCQVSDAALIAADDVTVTVTR